jgi:hypothetical protein
MNKIQINSTVEYTIDSFFFNLFKRKRKGIVKKIENDMAKIVTKNSVYSTITKWVKITDLKIL